MVPNKMEEEFRKALIGREIQPSEKAWDRLDAMLSVAEKDKPKRNFQWLYIAASLVLFFTVGFFLFQQQKAVLPELKNETVVDSDVISKPNKPVSQKNKEVASEEKTEQPFVEKPIALIKSKGLKKPVLTQVVGLSQSRGEQYKLNEDDFKPTLPKEDDKKEQIVADLKPEPVKQTTEKPKVKISANSLLTSVEGELNQEFRETTIDKIKKNFKTVKTAVVNRNYE